MSRNDWFCMDCRYLGPLAKNGSCPRCSSQAVVWPEAARSNKAAEVTELERMYALTVKAR